METQNYSIWRKVKHKSLNICRRKANTDMLFMVTCLIVLSFMHHTDASASNDNNRTVTLTSVGHPTTYSSSNDDTNDDPPGTGNIINYKLSEIVGTEDIVPVYSTSDQKIEVLVLDNSKTNSEDTNEIVGSCNEEPTVIYDAQNSELVETGVMNDESKLYRYAITDDEYRILLRVVEAEVTGERFTYKGTEVPTDELLKAKIRVAQVFLNRVEDTNKFSDDHSLKDALLRPGATSTLIDGRYYEVTITDLTRKAVDKALLNSTEDYTQGALFFSSGTTYCAYGDYIFTDEVGHAFFK